VRRGEGGTGETHKRALLTTGENWRINRESLYAPGKEIRKDPCQKRGGGGGLVRIKLGHGLSFRHDKPLEMRGKKMTLGQGCGIGKRGGIAH